MTELFDKTEEILEEDAEEMEQKQDEYQSSSSQVRRRLESILENKMLQDELEDSFDRLI